MKRCWTCEYSFVSEGVTKLIQKHFAGFRMKGFEQFLMNHEWDIWNIVSIDLNSDLKMPKEDGEIKSFAPDHAQVNIEASSFWTDND